MEHLQHDLQGRHLQLYVYNIIVVNCECAYLNLPGGQRKAEGRGGGQGC